MKKIRTNILIIAALVLLPGLQAAADTVADTDAEYFIDTGIKLNEGLFYGGAWAPGANGGAVSIAVERESAGLLLGAGVEAGANYTGFSLLFPLKAGLVFFEKSGLQASAEAALMPGMMLYRPTPYFLFAAGVTAELDWFVTDGFRLVLSAGPRYTTSPDYSNSISQLEMIDVTIGLGAGFKI